MPVERRNTKHGIRYRWVKMMNGQRYRSPFVFLKKKEADEGLAEWVAAFLTTGSPPTTTPTDSGQSLETVAEVLERRLSYLKIHGSPRHYHDTKGVFARALRYGVFWEKPAEQLTADDARVWAEAYQADLIARGRHPGKEVNRAISYLSTAFNGPWHSRRVPREYPQNPFLIEMFPTRKKAPYVPPDRDVGRVLAKLLELGPEKGLFLSFLACTAARQGEARSLRWEDIEPDRSQVVLYTRKKKGGHRLPRRVPISPDLVDQFEAWKRGREGDGPWVFPQNGKGDFRSFGWADRAQVKACKVASVKHFPPHSFRHWRARKWADEGLRLSGIKARLGHESLRITEEYLRSLGAQVEELSL